MARYKRIGVIFFAGLAIAALLLLSAGISRLELRPGRPLALERIAPNALPGSVSDGASPLEEFLRAVWSLVAVLCVVLLPFSIIHFILSPQARKRVLRELLMLVAFLIIYSLALLRVGQMAGASEAQAAATPATSQAVAEFTPPSDWLTFWVSLGLAGVTIVGGWLVWRRLRPPAPLPRLAREAQAAIEQLRAGGDLKNTVIRCYYEMSRVLSVRQGLRRSSSMTPREFEQRLAATGLPAEHVRRLTRLFEAARYSAETPGEREEREAVACLTAIVQACQQFA